MTSSDPERPPAAGVALCGEMHRWPTHPHIDAAATSRIGSPKNQAMNTIELRRTPTPLRPVVAPGLWLHAHRTAGGHRHHRHPGGDVVAGADQGQSQGAGDQLHRQHEATPLGLAPVLGRQQRSGGRDLDRGDQRLHQSWSAGRRRHARRHQHGPGPGGHCSRTTPISTFTDVRWTRSTGWRVAGQQRPQFIR